MFARLWVDPTDPLHLFAADVSLEESLNGGGVWVPAVGPHADQHAMAWDPNTTGRVYLGGDGGVWFSNVNGSGNWTHATVEPWIQPYHISVSQQDPLRLVIGLQDNGCSHSWSPGVEPTDLTQWHSYAGCGDGYSVQIDPVDQLTYYGCSQPTPPTIHCARSVDAAAVGSTSTGFSSPAWPSGTRIEVAMPMALDACDHKIVYVGGTSIARSAEGSVSSWTLISPTTPDSPESLPGPVPPEQINQDTYYANEYGAVTQIATAKTTGTATTPCGTVYAGTDTGLLWKTTNANATPASSIVWTRLGEGVLPQSWVTSIAVDPTDENHVFVSFSAYKNGDRAANVWETADGGASWSNVSGNLPNAPVLTVTYDQPDHQLFVADGFGVFYRGESETSWTRLGTGLPNAPVMDLKLTGDRSTIYAANYGRGVWKIPRPQNPTAVVLRSFSAVRARNGVLLRWRTGAEAGLLGFDLYRGGLRLNRSLIPAAHSAAGAAYRYVDRRAPSASARYRLEAVRPDGSRVWLGATRVR